MDLQRTIFRRLYRKATGVDDLPWHREDPPQLLARALAERSSPGSALDLGCGEGTHAVHLAQQGYEVVGIDVVPAAPAPFDVVLDSGCLHHLRGRRVDAYRARLDRWLAPGGGLPCDERLTRPPALAPRG